MAILKDSGRQYPLVAKVDFTQPDLPTGTAVLAVDLPGGARVIGGQIAVTTAFDSATSDTLTVGDGTTADRYAAGVNGQVAGVTALTPDELANGATSAGVYITNTAAGAEGTAGVGFLEVHYVIEGRANEAQPQ